MGRLQTIAGVDESEWFQETVNGGRDLSCEALEGFTNERAYGEHNEQEPENEGVVHYPEEGLAKKGC